MGKKNTYHVILTLLMCVLFSSCFRPPYNDFENDHRVLETSVGAAGAGAGVGALVGTVAGGVLTGTAIGGVAGGVVALYSNTEKKLIRKLAKQDIRFIQYGDTRELIIPVDKYFEFNSHRLREQCYQGLNDVARLLAFYACNPIYVAGFSDDVGGARARTELSRARAEQIVGFLWAKGIAAQRLHAEGYGDEFSVGENSLVHGSAYNRRVEIQWVNKEICPREPVVIYDSK